MLSCQFCGCTDDHACPGGCAWVSIDPPVCSACVEPGVEAESFAGPVCAHRPLFSTPTQGRCVDCGEFICVEAA